MTRAAKTTRRYREKNAVYAERYNCTVRSVTRYKAQGFPLDDREAMREILDGQKNSPAAPSDDESLESEVPVEKISVAEAKRRKTIAEFQRIAFRLDVERGMYELKTSVVESGYSIASVIGASLDKLSADLPALLLGLPETEMSAVIRRETDKVRAQLANRISKLGGR